MSESSRPESDPLLSIRDVDNTEVYPVIHHIRNDIITFIDTPLSYEALTAPDLTYTLIRPLFEKYANWQRGGNMSIVFCLLLNRVHFIRDQNMASHAISRTRAELCEILAIRALREYGSDIYDLVLTLTTSWSVYSGADPVVMRLAREEHEDLEERVGNAIEMAILGKAKRFIKSSACQKVIDGIWTGKYVYQATSSHSILADTYKRTPIHFYDPHKAPLLDHYRLKVPFIRSALEYTNFIILFILFVLAIEMNDLHHINRYEFLFGVYALGFSLEKMAAMQEHGIQVYVKGTWNGFDVAFITTYIIYVVLRVYGIYTHNYWARTTGTSFLALIACLMFPRLAFVTLRNNLMVLSLRAMIMQFAALMLIAAFCFCGFLYALWTLGRSGTTHSIGTIAWWMLDLWFGLDASGFQNAQEFHSVFGPILMVTYACLSNTLLLTVLVSILSNTFSTVNEDAAAEAMFRKAVSTIEGVKADYLFSYQPPVNLVALVIVLPSSYILTPRYFHKFNVFMIRVTNFPILLLIALYERQAKRHGTNGFYDTISAILERIWDTLPRGLTKRIAFFDLAGSDADIDAIFEVEDELMESSALDSRDIDVSNPSGTVSHFQRRNSPFSSPGPPLVAAGRSESGDRHAHFDAPLSTAERRQQHKESMQVSTSPTGVPHMRARVNSVMSRGLEAAQSFTSPLAQIFQPLVVDDTDGTEDAVSLENGNQGPAPLVSFGPASRRRLTSISGAAVAHRRTTSEIGRVSPPGVGRMISINRHRRANPQVDEFGGVLSESPQSGNGSIGVGSSPGRTGSPGAVQIQTAAQIKAGENEGGGLDRRMEEMEERQKRMEALMEKIADALEKK
ncbi:hypothetical protein CYLTODRAFT_494529 [Cylindrobasidium torrendii FP15055 ss-10]|uniref:Receptor-activated Ca2+-permeable cation channel n=1 Tax=Cylindrobasidium torrendii FP15055 ss-10 TaxID=1314674 RepID=A0A0D7AZ86_9AGAR|nr:hypothetical protein CYLTODRAFT_494529 [Cylindrobasidium torrendii FP15055 ss-10]